MTIPHIEFARLSNALLQERCELGHKAERILGYSRLAQATTQGTLLHTLRKLDIAPLSSIKVKNYMVKKAKPGIWSSTKDKLWTAAIAIGLFGSACLFNSFANWEKGPFLMPLMTIVSLILAVIVTIMFFVAFENGSGTRIKREWRSASLPSFSSIGNVPEFVLEKAIAIKEKLPAVNFSVEYLVDNHEVRDPDPFLVAVLENERYYIDVWDEKEYEKAI